MIRVSGSDGMDAEQFEEDLELLLEFAKKEGVDIEGGWDIDPDDDPHLFSVEITRVQKRD